MCPNYIFIGSKRIENMLHPLKKKIPRRKRKHDFSHTHSLTLSLIIMRTFFGVHMK
jgi:hypothetical protein